MHSNESPQWVTEIRPHTVIVVGPNGNARLTFASGEDAWAAHDVLLAAGLNVRLNLTTGHAVDPMHSDCDDEGCGACYERTGEGLY